MPPPPSPIYFPILWYQRMGMHLQKNRHVFAKNDPSRRRTKSPWTPSQKTERKCICTCKTKNSRAKEYTDKSLYEITQSCHGVLSIRAASTYESILFISLGGKKNLIFRKACMIGVLFTILWMN